MKKFLPALVAIGALTLAGCAATGAGPSGAPASSAPASAPAEVDAVLASAGLEGQDTEQVIAALEASTEDRTAGPMGSVRYDHVLLAGEAGEVAMPIPDDLFYLSIAPYVERTHDCYYHNLATCQGELAGEAVHVSVTDAAGATLVDQDVTLEANGFTGLWLPRDTTGELTVTYDDKQVTTPIATGPEDPTCLTTLQLS